MVITLKTYQNHLTLLQYRRMSPSEGRAILQLWKERLVRIESQWSQVFATPIRKAVMTTNLHSTLGTHLERVSYSKLSR